jgi:hypothetical protein
LPYAVLPDVQVSEAEGEVWKLRSSLQSVEDALEEQKLARMDMEKRLAQLHKDNKHHQ